MLNKEHIFIKSMCIHRLHIVEAFNKHNYFAPTELGKLR
jgi:hypothetical protein